ncbi:selenocysteine-specific translation elongation factor [Myxococcota bacterium]|nr:selenocysteine-specific translation elongation factor [Myxococcota bacterium]
MASFVIGTAGHIDHGKTRLVRALTGVDTDRLAEEQRRGITIELGFAPIRLPSGARGGVVDVPGHERLVRTMVAGATGIDLALLVVAADEGVMPQTREHLDILRLLEVSRMVVALSKTDVVDADLAELAAEEVSSHLQGTPFAGSPVVPVSSATGDGIEALRALLDAVVTRLPRRPHEGPFRVPVDRAFSMRGFGTVVTGTCVSGRVSVADEVEVLPARVRTRVRGVQVHGQTVPEAGPSHRVALNLQGISTEDIPRGSVVCAPDSVPVTSMADVRLHYLASAGEPLPTRTRVRFLTGTAEALGVVQVVGRGDEADLREVEPGWTGWAQVRLDAPLALSRGDRFVLRRTSPMVTLGGGVVLDPQPQRHRPRESRGRRALLGALDGQPSPATALDAVLEAGIPRPFEARELALRLGLPREAVKEGLVTLAGQGRALVLEGGRHVHAGVVARLRPAVLQELAAFHAAEPLLPGMPRNHLRTRLPGHLEARLFAAVLDALVADGSAQADEQSVRLPGHVPRTSEEQAAAILQLDRVYREAGWEPPDLAEAAEALGGRSDVPALVAHLQRAGRIVRVREDVLLHCEAWERLVETVRARLEGGGEMDPVAFKDLTGLSRRLAIPMLEHLDRQKVTVRVGNVRRWRGEHS